MNITFQKAKLHALTDLFPAFAEIAQQAVDMNPEACLADLHRYAPRGADCVMAYDDETMIGYALYGPAEKFIRWADQMPLLLELAKRGRKNVYMGAHFHLLKGYWGKGVHLKMIREYSQDIVNRGGTDYLIWGARTRALSDYSNSKPGTEVLEGFVDSRGFPVGLRRIRDYLAGTE